MGTMGPAGPPGAPGEAPLFGKSDVLLLLGLYFFKFIKVTFNSFQHTH